MNDQKAKLFGTCLDAEHVIDYQEGAVVSRTILDKSIGTITFFAFDQGEGLSEHTSPYDAFVYIVDGKAEITIDGDSISVEKNNCIIMPANKPHALKAPERFKMMLVMIREKQEEA